MIEKLVETIKAFLKVTYRAYFPKYGISKEESKALREHITGSFLIETNIQRLFLFYPFLYLILIIEIGNFSEDCARIQNRASCLPLFA